MAASLKRIENGNRYAVFFIDDAEDVQLLPTVSAPGKANLSTVNGVMQGSIAYLTTDASKAYRLSGKNIWTKIDIAISGGGSSGGGGGGGASGNTITFDDDGNIIDTSGNIGFTTDDDIDAMFP